MHTVVDMGTHYYQVCIWTGRTDFYRRREAYAGITSSLSTATLSAAAELVARGDAFPLTAMRRANPSTHHTTVERTPIPEPPGGLFEVVRYRAPLGENAVVRMQEVGGAGTQPLLFSPRTPASSARRR